MFTEESGGLYAENDVGETVLDAPDPTTLAGKGAESDLKMSVEGVGTLGTGVSMEGVAVFITAVGRGAERLDIDGDGGVFAAGSTVGSGAGADGVTTGLVLKSPPYEVLGVEDVGIGAWRIERASIVLIYAFRA